MIREHHSTSSRAEALARLGRREDAIRALQELILRQEDYSWFMTLSPSRPGSTAQEPKRRPEDVWGGRRTDTRRFRAELHLKLGRVLCYAGRRAEGFAEMQKSVLLASESDAPQPKRAFLDNGSFGGLVPDLPSFYMTAARQFLEFGGGQKALGPYERAVRIAPRIETAQGNAGVAELQNNLAWHLATAEDAQLRNSAKAVALAKAAVNGVPNPGYWNTLGVAQVRHGDYEQGVSSLEKSCQLSAGGTAFDWFFLAIAKWELGDHAAAEQWLRKAVDWMDTKSPQNEELLRFRCEAECLIGTPAEVRE